MKPWSVDTKCPEIYLALLELAKRKGWRGSAIEALPDAYRWIIVGGDFIDGHSGKLSGHENYLIETAIERFAKGPSDPPIRIGDNVVKFHDDGSITVGCEHIPRGLVVKIYEKAAKRHGEKLHKCVEELDNPDDDDWFDDATKRPV